jgi:hypothetical protein
MSTDIGSLEDVRTRTVSGAKADAPPQACRFSFDQN